MSEAGKQGSAAPMSDFEIRRLAQRYADDTDFQKEVDQALGVYHVPRCPTGTCVGCDKQRIKEAVNADVE